MACDLTLAHAFSDQAILTGLRSSPCACAHLTDGLLTLVECDTPSGIEPYRLVSDPTIHRALSDQTILHGFRSPFMPALSDRTVLPGLRSSLCTYVHLADDPLTLVECGPDCRNADGLNLVGLCRGSRCLSTLD